MAAIKPSASIDQYTARLLEAARKTVAQEIAELHQTNIPIYYHPYPGGPLVEELPDGSKTFVTPPKHG